MPNYFWCFIMTIIISIGSSYASPVLECKSYPFLKPAFSETNYRNCKQLLQSCPLSGPYPSTACIQQIAKNNRSCNQLSQLAKVLHATPATLSMERIGNFALIDQVFIADGQHSYYILTPKNCLINTKIDPRNLSAALKEDYKNFPFVITNWDKPKIVKTGDQITNIIATLKITKTCIACELVGYAQIHYEFDEAGKLINVNLPNDSLSETPAS
ncbi:MAG: hypothetical protein H0W64_01670 [Gammaproteobacteria bacterium]|nr:hypothetical protein [Gammaproteobacteria bacterium]